MKNINLLLLVLSFFLIACNNNSKQILSTESVPDSNTTTEATAIEDNSKSDTINNSKQVLSTESTSDNNVATESTTIENNSKSDAIVFDDRKVFNTPWLKDPKGFFRENNRYKDWDENDKKEVLLNFSTLKDGTNINVRVRKSSGVQKLDDEAIRLVQIMKHDEPAIDVNKNPVNVETMSIKIFFPPK